MDFVPRGRVQHVSDPPKTTSAARARSNYATIFSRFFFPYFSFACRLTVRRLSSLRHGVFFLFLIFFFPALFSFPRVRRQTHGAGHGIRVLYDNLLFGPVLAPRHDRRLWRISFRARDLGERPERNGWVVGGGRG